MTEKIEKVAGYPQSMTGKKLHYCPGCTHGIVHRLIGEVIDELNIKEKTIGIAPVGCSVLAYDYFDVDMQEAAHGRAPAVATGIKRVHPDSFVFSYQGDGDLASIGMAEIVHAANRGEKISVIFINNAIYGMTGGQMAPTTLEGQVTTTTPRGRNSEQAGGPLKISEMLSVIEGAVYVTRVSTHNLEHIARTRAALKKSFEVQLRGEGFSLVEILSTCPTNWGVTPAEAMKWVEEKMMPVFPVKEFCTPEEQ